VEHNAGLGAAQALQVCCQDVSAHQEVVLPARLPEDALPWATAVWDALGVFRQDVMEAVPFRALTPPSDEVAEKLAAPAQDARVQDA
jgi:hypothetical protein